MPLRLQIISRHRQGLGERSVKEFGRDGGTIGRSLESDWVLPDGQRYVSSRHASIDFRSGSYYVVDTSTNGVYVNDSEQPVGRGNPQRLFTGDRVRIGEYEISVEVDEHDNTSQQLADNRHVDPVSRAQRVPAPDPTRADLVQPHEITAVGIEVLLREEAHTAEVQQAAQLAAASLRLEDEPTPIKIHEPPPVSAAARLAASLAGKEPAAPKNARAPAAGNGARNGAHVPAAAGKTGPGTNTAAANATSVTLDAFFRGAGLPALRLDDKQIEQTLHRLGQLMRELILGLNENLHLRTEQKNALRVPTTTIQPQNNNPLKFSASVDESLGNLLFRNTSEYLQAVESVREAFTDIKQHQQSLLGALRIAIADYIARLDPEELENKFSGGKRGGIMNAANKLKYWDLYKDLYQVVAQGQPGQLPQQFLEELSRAYEQEGTRAAATRKPQAKAL
ncbi:MAG TPA: type VI secretion system-associated FHA domain protein TagH [Gammaproteobacteria bacterium]|nr:type VI secretion system-associated FHA domain protein TagH [Gammaproteobacteria bacterium]